MLDEHGRLKRRRDGEEASASSDGGAPDLSSVAASVRRYADPRFWRAVSRRRRLAVLGVASALVALLAVIALAWAMLALSAAENVPPARTYITRAPDEAPSSAQATSSLSASGGSAPDTGTARAPGSDPPRKRAPLVPYRAEGAVWVVGEAGDGARRVIASSSGPFALSGDGKRLAVVDGVASRLWIVDVATGARRDVGPAVPVRPEWSPDSQWLLYSRPIGDDQEIVRVAAGGHGATALMRGVRGRFVRGADVAVAAPRTAVLPSQVVAVYSDGRSLRIASKVSSVEVVPSPRGMYVSDAGDGTSPPSIRYVAGDGGSELTIVNAPVAGSNVHLTDLSVSPEGTWLVWAETRDDGYSRMFARSASGLKTIPLKAHRDCYLIGWSADGTELLRIEGNAAQGESTRLTAVRPDGTGWRVVMEGAGI